jgi:hypothetical protein
LTSIPSPWQLGTAWFASPPTAPTRMDKGVIRGQRPASSSPVPASLARQLRLLTIPRLIPTIILIGKPRADYLAILISRNPFRYHKLENPKKISWTRARKCHSSASCGRSLNNSPPLCLWGWGSRLVWPGSGYSLNWAGDGPWLSSVALSCCSSWRFAVSRKIHDLVKRFRAGFLECSALLPHWGIVVLVGYGNPPGLR